MKNKIQIKNRYTSKVIVEMEAETLKAYLQEAYLRGAYLQEAYLWGADLRGAYLRGAYLREAKGFKLYWHIHHDQLVENLTEPLKNRIKFIKEKKPEDERKLRLKLLKKVECKPENYPTTLEGWGELHKKECPNCPWNGETIFPDKE